MNKLAILAARKCLLEATRKHVQRYHGEIFVAARKTTLPAGQ